MRPWFRLWRLVAVVLLTSCGGSATVDSGLQGTLLFDHLDDKDRSQVFRINLKDGSREQISMATTAFGAVGLRESPDGSAVIYTEFNDAVGRAELVVDFEDDRDSMIISDTSSNEAVPAWSIDCQSLFFGRFTGDGNSSIWRMKIDGSEREIHFASSAGFATGPDQSHHHGLLLFHSSHESNGEQSSIYAIKIGPGDPVRVTPVGMNAAWGRWSPVADEIVFQEMTPDGSMSRVAIISGDGTELRALTEFEADVRIPVWSPDGEWVAFRRADLSMIAVHVGTQEEIDLGVTGAASDWGPHDRQCPTNGSSASSQP